MPRPDAVTPGFAARTDNILNQLADAWNAKHGNELSDFAEVVGGRLIVRDDEGNVYNLAPDYPCSVDGELGNLD